MEIQQRLGRIVLLASDKRQCIEGLLLNVAVDRGQMLQVLKELLGLVVIACFVINAADKKQDLY